MALGEALGTKRLIKFHCPLRVGLGETLCVRWASIAFTGLHRLWNLALLSSFFVDFLRDSPLEASNIVVIFPTLFPSFPILSFFLFPGLVREF